MLHRCAGVVSLSEARAPRAGRLLAAGCSAAWASKWHEPRDANQIVGDEVKQKAGGDTQQAVMDGDPAIGEAASDRQHCLGGTPLGGAGGLLSTLATASPWRFSMVTHPMWHSFASSPPPCGGDRRGRNRGA